MRFSILILPPSAANAGIIWKIFSNVVFFSWNLATHPEGIGEAMLREIARLGMARGFERIDFQVLGWNAPAIRFYEKLGAECDEEERHFRFTDEAFEALVSADESEPPA